MTLMGAAAATHQYAAAPYKLVELINFIPSFKKTLFDESEQESIEIQLFLQLFL